MKNLKLINAASVFHFINFLSLGKFKDGFHRHVKNCKINGVLRKLKRVTMAGYISLRKFLILFIFIVIVFVVSLFCRFTILCYSVISTAFSLVAFLLF